MKRFIRIDLEYDDTEHKSLTEIIENIKTILEHELDFDRVKVINTRNCPTLAELNDPFFRKCATDDIK